MMSAPPPTTTFSMPGNWQSVPTSDFDDLGATNSTSNAPFDFESGERNATKWSENHYAKRYRPRNSSSNTPDPMPKPARSSLTANTSNSPGFLFVTATKPTDFKEKGIMQQVRKKAMNNYLEKKPKPYRSSTELDEKRPRSRDSNSSISKPATQDSGIELEETIKDVISNDQALRILRGEKKKTSRRTTSPVHSVHSVSSANDEQSVVSPKVVQQAIRRESRSFLDSASMVMAPAPVIIPSRRGKLPYDLYVMRPFQSIGKPLDPFRAMHQSSHQKVGVEELKFYCSRIFGTRAMGQYWIPIITTSPQTFLSTLCISSAHLDAVNNRFIESIQTTALVQEIIHMISQSLLDPQKRIDDLNVVALTQLICSETIMGRDVVLEYHESGIEAMIKQRGGLESLGKNGWIAKVLTWVSLESAVLREKEPRQIYLNYWKHLPKNTYPNTATIPESPLWCPRTEFETLKHSDRHETRTYDILKDVRIMTDLFLDQNVNSNPNSNRTRDNSLKIFYKRITALPSIHDLKPNVVLTVNDWTYEACRIAAAIQATALSKRIPFSQAATDAASPSSTSSSTSPSRSSHQQQPRHSIVSASSGISPTNTRTDSPMDPFSFPFNGSTSPVFSPTAPSTVSTDTNTATSLLSSLRTAIDSSSLGAAWAESNLTGVLLWIALAAAPASRPTVSSFSSGSTNSISSQPQDSLRKWFNALAVRCSILLCFQHPEGVLGAVGRMALVQEKIRSEAKSMAVNVRGRGNGDGDKKRRTS